MKKRIVPVLTFLLLGVAGCKEDMPTAVSEDLIPSAPRTVEVRLPWDAFALDLKVFGGYGVPSEVGLGVLAHEYAGALEARTLARVVVPLPRLVTVVDSTGSTVTDTLGYIQSGWVVAHFDSLSEALPEAMTVSAHRLLGSWHPLTASWALAVDTTGDRREWPTAGGEPATLIGTGDWTAGQGDSLIVPVDSATLAVWGDTLDVGRGVRLDMETPDVRLEIRDLFLRYNVVPAANPDTVVTLTADTDTSTFIYSPEAEPPTSGLRVGGAPAWRSFITTAIPKVLTGPPEVCAVLGCPFEITPGSVSHAALVLRTREVVPRAFEPIDSALIDLRPVLAPERLPKAPLAGSLVTSYQNLTNGLPIAGSAFREGSTISVGVPVTGFVRAQVGEPPENGLPLANTLALLSAYEPFSIAFAEFAGPDDPERAPLLQLILTVADSVRLP